MKFREEFEKREKGFISPFGCMSTESRGRMKEEESCPIRTAYQVDRDRIVYSNACRRLKYKTQVFLARIQHNQKSYTNFLNRLQSIYASMDKKYQELADHYGFHCTGCEDNCCFTRFYHNTLLEYLYVMEGYNNLTQEKKVDVKRKALGVCQKSDRADETGLPVKLMCPLNYRGLCLIYEHRPMICRLHGISHELHMPGRNIVYGSGCEAFTQQSQGKKPFNIDRTPFYVEMAELEKDLRETVDMTQKIKMTLAQMITSFPD